MKNIFRKSAEKIFLEIFWKVKNFQKFSLKINTQFSKKSGGKNRKFFDFFGFFSKILYWFSMNIFEIFDFSKKYPKNIFSALFRKIFSSQENLFFSGTKFLKSKIYSGIKKSYLENRTSILNEFKIKNPTFLTHISLKLYSVTYTDPKLKRTENQKLRFNCRLCNRCLISRRTELVCN